MSDAQSSTSLANCQESSPDVRTERIIKRGDTTYELWVGPCRCGGSVYRLMRTCRSSISIYDISKEDLENLDEYVAELHASFAVDVEAKLQLLREMVAEFNSHGFFDAKELDVFRVRLIDKARLIFTRFATNGSIQKILEPDDDPENDLRSAFLLGCLATENFWIETHEEAVFEGYAHIEGREYGRPLATAARVRQGRLTRRAVVEAAAQLYKKHPPSKTALRIESMKLERLRKRDGTYLGSDAIIKHLRNARNQGEL
jgi:hypothetical protein